MDLDNQKKDTQTPTTVDSVTDNDAPKNTTLNNTLDFGVGSQEITDQVAEKIKHGTNILIALSKDPNLDEISAAIALAIILDQQKKHVTAIYSGKTPNALEFLKPEETFQKDTSSLQDFIIALNKSKADHLTYQIDGDYVKIFITPYKRQVTKEDLEYSYGDYNVDLVIVFNVNAGSEIDSALSEYGRIMHDATAINITSGVPGHFADLEWSDPSKSSVCEMVYDLINVLDIDSISQEVATALLTGILSATERFANNRTKPTTMAVASKLMEAGADQQLISSNILKPEPSPVETSVNNQNQTLNTTSSYNTQNTDNSIQDLDTGERKLEQLVNQNINSTSLVSNQVTDHTGPFNTSTSDSSNQASFTAPATNVMDDLARATDDLMNNHQKLQSQIAQQQTYQPASSQPYSPANQPQPNNQTVQANQFDYQPTQNYQAPQSQNYPPKQPLSSPVQPLFNPSTQSAETSQLNSAQQSSLDSSIQSPQTVPNNYQTASQLDQSGSQPSNNQFQVPVSQQPVDQYQTQQLNQFSSQSAQPFTGQNQFQTNFSPANQPQPNNQTVQANQFDYQPTQNYQAPQAQTYPSEQSSLLSPQSFSNTSSQSIVNSSPQPFSNTSAQSIEASQPNPVQQSSFREQTQPTSNPEVFGHTIAEPVAEPEQDMSRLMDEALAEPSPIQNPVGYQSMINQSNYINQSLAQNNPSPEKLNYPLAVGQQPIVDYVPGQNLATISAPAIPSVQQNPNYPNPEYTNTVPNYQAPTMPMLPNNPNQMPPASSPIVPPSTQSVPNMQSNPATPNSTTNQQTSPSPMQAINFTESYPVDTQNAPVPQQAVPSTQTMPAQDFIQTTPPATNTPIPDYLRPESFLPPAPNPVVLDQSAPLISPPVTPDSISLFPPQAPLTSPQLEQPQQTSSQLQSSNNQFQAPVPQQSVNQPQAQPLAQTSAPTQPFPPSPAQDSSQSLSQTQISPQPVPVNPVQTDPSAFHIPGSY